MSPTPSPRGEFALIARYFAPLSQGFSGAYGLRDDVAAIASSPGQELVLKTDAIVAGVDFPPDEEPGHVARKALRVNLSDLAAKGAIPRAYLLNLILPRTVDEGWIAAFAGGLAQDQVEYGVDLIGGDMSSTAGPIAIAITALGEAPTGRLIRRGGAQAGDLIFVTGTIGDAGLGLRLLAGGLPELDRTSREYLIDRYRLPRPRIALGPRLIGVATASLDVSDGLVADLRHICEVSGLSARVEAPLIPLSPAAREAIAIDPRHLETILTAGDDYEILFTAPPTSTAALADLERSLGIPITAIGRMTERSLTKQSPVTVTDAENRPLTFASEGWTHFGGGETRPASP